MLPPSTNAIYAPRRGGHGIIMRKEAVDWVSQATLFLPPLKLPDDVQYRMELAYYSNWYTKGGKVKTKDVRNYEKLVTDTVYRRYGLNDSLIWESLVYKVQDADKEKVVVKLFTL